MKKQTLYMLVVLSAALLMAACGGGADLSRPVKTATITFSTRSNVTLSDSMQLIVLDANLPPGVSATPDPVNPGYIDPSTLRGPAGLSPQGSILNGGQTVRIALVVNKSAAIPLGDFAVLTCKLTQGSALTETQFINANIPFPHFECNGLSANNNIVDFTIGGMVTPQLKVIFNN